MVWILLVPKKNENTMDVQKLVCGEVMGRARVLLPEELAYVLLGIEP